MPRYRPFWILELFAVVFFVLILGVPFLFAQINATDHLIGITFTDYLIAAAVLTGIILLVTFLAKRVV